MHHHLTETAGAPGATLELARQFRRLGHEADLFSFDDLPARLTEPVALALFPFYLQRHLRRSPPYDVVDAAVGDAWLTTLRRPGDRPGPLLVARSHGLEHGGHERTVERAHRTGEQLSWKYRLYRGGLHLRLVATALRRSDLALLLNQPDMDRAVGQLGVRPERAHLVHNGIRPGLLGLPFPPTPLEPGSPIGIAFVGSYIWRKGIEQAAAALPAVLGRHPEVRVGFFGTGCSEDRVLADYDGALAARIDVVPRYEPEVLSQLLAAYQILLFPTLGEGFSLALVEAMACGLAPVTTDAPGPAEAVRPGIDGLIVPAGDAPALAGALERLLADRAELDSLRQSAHARAQQYSWEVVAAEAMALYDQCLRTRLT
ncbi:MAG TPA: glycosyltransferase family 4 protein [Acidimicrobiales bacterium]|nr:glycosyltransferase family 4 protein [Acidimicrobiales bacterium]